MEKINQTFSPNGQFKAVVTKGMLFGYEADLKLDKYAVLNNKRGQNATAERFEDAMWFPTLDKALTEAQLCVVEQGRKQDKFVVYAVRTDRMLSVEAWEVMACCEKYPTKS